MIYANIAVNHRSVSDVFTYTLKPDQLLDIKKGSLVEVPFGNRALEGIVVDLKKTAKVQHSKIKPVKRILSRQAVITGRQMALAYWLADNYGVSLGQAIFTIMPRLNRKLL